jgi:hypothetical protein
LNKFGPKIEKIDNIRKLFYVQILEVYGGGAPVPFGRTA